MAEDQDPSSSLEFELGAAGAAKRPEQLVALLTRVLAQEFPESHALVDIVCDKQRSCVSVRNLDSLDEHTSRDLAHRARGVFHDFMTSPWY